MYIIQHNANGEPRYFIRQTFGITTWGTKAGAATRYKTEAEARAIAERLLKSFACTIVKA